MSVHTQPYSQAFSLLCAQCVCVHIRIVHGGGRRPGSEANAYMYMYMCVLIHVIQTRTSVHVIYVYVYVRMYEFVYTCTYAHSLVYVCL